MSRADHRDTIVQAVLDGIERAAKTWMKMSGMWMDRGPEYWVTTEIARRLDKVLASKWITMEPGIKSSHEEAGVKEGLENLNLRGRFDIVVYYQSKDQPRAVIEVKHRFDNKWARALKNDARRVIETVKLRRAGSTLAHGLQALYLEVGKRTYDDAAKVWHEKAAAICEEAKLHLKNHPGAEGVQLKVHLGKPRPWSKTDGSGAWGAMVLEYWQPTKRQPKG